MTTLAVIAAVAKNGAIGKDNKLLWRLRDDMQLFVKTTTGHAVIMGRKTFESLKGPLPKRQNIVITRQVNYEADNVEIAHNMDDAIALVKGETAFVIGGGIIYAEAMNLADKLYISHVDDLVHDADTFFPEVDYEQWEKVDCQAFEKDERNEKNFEFCSYERKLPIKNSNT